MEHVNNVILIQNEKSSLPLRNINNKDGSIITTVMSTHLVRKPQNEDVLFKSERFNNDEDIESIETKLNDLKKENDNFTRENFISNREFNIPEKKIEDEINIISKDKLDKEKKQQQYEKNLKNEMEIHKKKMEEDEAKIKKYYQRRNNNNKNITILMISLIITIIALTIILIYILW